MIRWIVESSIVIYTKNKESSSSSIILIDIFPTRKDGKTSRCRIRIFTLPDKKKIRKRLCNSYLKALRDITVPYNTVLLNNTIINELNRITDIRRLGEYFQLTPAFRSGTEILYKYAIR